ncbi:MAG TPA: hypothetical protein VL992_02295 [Tepidisphaeraceae bacterium]|nr:hypothetical protein [Tepidisphaeraceae bacterium]
MPWRAVAIFLSVYLFIWFEIIIPVHRRGCVTVPGAAPTCCCCCCCGQTANSPHAPHGSSQCAICYFAAHLDIPPVTDLTLPPMGLADRLDPPAAERAVQRIVLFPYQSRGPPRVA